MPLIVPAPARAISEERCERCKFSTASPQPGAGVMLECRRFPPQVVAAAPGQLTALFPVVDPTAKCGEFQKKVLLDS